MGDEVKKVEVVTTVTKTMVKLNYNGKDVEREQVVPGLVKAGNAYLVRCQRTGAYTYCNEARLAKLTAKYGSIENVGLNYVGRDGKKEVKKEVAAAAAQAEAAKAADAPAAEAPKAG